MFILPVLRLFVFNLHIRVKTKTFIIKYSIFLQETGFPVYNLEDIHRTVIRNMATPKIRSIIIDRIQ